MKRTVSLPRSTSSSSSSKRAKTMKSSKMKSFRTMSGAQLRREYTLAKFPIKMTTRTILTVYNTTGWQNTTPSLCFAYSLKGVSFSLGGGGFTTADFDNTQYLTPVFDEWRLIRVENTLSCGLESFDPIGNRNMISVYSAIDTNDAEITGLQDVWGYATVRKHTLGANGKEYKRVIMGPGTQGSVETTSLGFTTASVKKVSPWLSCDSTNVAHYGLKYVVDTNNATAWSMLVTFFHECYFELRNTK